MNITLHNATISAGSDLILMDINHAVMVDEKTAENLRKHFDGICHLLPQSIYGACCVLDGQPCNGNKAKCRKKGK